MNDKATTLDVTGLCKRFASAAGDIDVLTNLSFQVHAGEFVAIIGESGSGKSTLLHLLGTLEAADTGTIRLNNQDISCLSSKQAASVRNREIGFIYQAHHLIPELDAVENVMLPLLVRGIPRKAAKVDSIALLRRLGLGERLLHRPGKLSGGEAQRVAVARALIGKPTLILADEPTGNLDANSADEVFALLRQLCQEEQTAVAMVTHSLQLAAMSDRAFLLNDGELKPWCP
ncbi:MAG: ABC transporter ATP-binding protein [Mariprofundaceae bacterium]